MRGSIGECKYAGGIQVHACGHARSSIRFGDGKFGKSAPIGQRGHSVTWTEVVDSGTDGSDNAGKFAARRKRQVRLELIFVLDNERVRKIKTRGMHADLYLALPWLGNWDCAQTQLLPRSIRL